MHKGHSRFPASLFWHLTNEVLTYAGVELLCDVQAAPIGEEATGQFVMTLRSVQLPNVPPTELQ